MWKSLTPATAIALAMGLGACTNMEGPLSFIPSPSESVTKASLIPDRHDIANEMRLADASMKAGDAASAIAIYRRLARDYPLAMAPRVALGDALLAANAPQDAERAYQGALKLNGDSHHAMTGLGRVELALHRPAEALLYFDKAARARPADTAAENGRAVALDQLGRHDEAQAVYLDLLSHDPTNSRIRNNYALSLALAGKYDQSSDILTGLAAAPDSEARTRQNLALVYGLAGNDGQAAHVARIDLDEEAVHNNIQYFQRLRHEESPIVKGAALLNPSGAPVESAHAATPRKMHKAEAAPAPLAAAESAGEVATASPAAIAPPAESRDVAELPATPVKEPKARTHSYFSFFGGSNKPADVPPMPSMAAGPSNVHTATAVVAPAPAPAPARVAVRPAAAAAAPLPVETALTADDLKPEVEVPMPEVPPVAAEVQAPKPAPVTRVSESKPARRSAAVPAATIDPAEAAILAPHTTEPDAKPSPSPVKAELSVPKATDANPIDNPAPGAGIKAEIETTNPPQARGAAVPPVASIGQGVSGSIRPAHHRHHAPAVPVVSNAVDGNLAEMVPTPAVLSPRG